MSRLTWSLLVVVTLGVSSGAHAQCDVLDFGAADDDPVTIEDNTDLDDDCTLDFGDREVILAADLTGSNLTLMAARLTIDPGASIMGGDSTTTIILTSSATHDGAFTLSGEIDHNDPDDPGTVIITTDGSIGFSGGGNIRARGLTVDADGGTVEITAGDFVTIDGAATSINVSAGSDSWGGTVEITSTGTITLVQNINASGGSSDGGFVDLTADEAVEVEGNIDVNAGCFDGFCGDGGEVTIVAGTSITVTGQIDSRGPTGGLEDGGGYGGYVTLDAATDITIDNNIDLSCGYYGDGGNFTATCVGTYEHLSGRTRCDGRNVDSWGGIIDITAGDALLLGTHEAGGGSDGVGGDITITTVERLQIDGNILCSSNGGGTLALESTAADVIITSQLTAEGRGAGGAGASMAITAFTGIDVSGAHLDVSGNGTSGEGGTVALSTGLDVVADDATRVRANGSGPGGSGGTGGVIEIDGCAVTFPADSLTFARGATGGNISITSLDLLTLGGRVEADTDGVITLTYPLDVDPDVDDADFDPDYDSIEVVSPPACTDPVDGPLFMRGDVDGNGATSALVDALTLLSWAFADGSAPPCEKAGDVDANGAVSALTDALFLLDFVFGDGDSPSDPGPTTCGEDPDETSVLTCETPSTVCS